MPLLTVVHSQTIHTTHSLRLKIGEEDDLYRNQDWRDSQRSDPIPPCSLMEWRRFAG